MLEQSLCTSFGQPSSASTFCAFPSCHFLFSCLFLVFFFFAFKVSSEFPVYPDRLLLHLCNFLHIRIDWFCAQRRLSLKITRPSWLLCSPEQFFTESCQAGPSTNPDWILDFMYFNYMTCSFLQDVKVYNLTFTPAKVTFYLHIFLVCE